MPYPCFTVGHQCSSRGLRLHSSAPSSHSMSNYTIDTQSFETYYDTALLSTFGTCTQLLLFGILLVLLFNTTYLLHTPVCASRGWLVAATCAMGLFAALHLALQIAGTGDAARALSMLNRGAVLKIVNDSLVVANNTVTDGIFIYRCYVIWGRDVKVVIVPALLLVAGTVIGSLGTPPPNQVGRLGDYRLVFGMLNLTTNLMLMALTAGRIWWIRRDVASVLEPSATRTYDTVLAMILESGAINCISIILFLTVARLNKHNSLAAISVFRAVIPQIMNIAPILILARVGSGRSVGDKTISSGALDSSRWRFDQQQSVVMRPANSSQPEFG
ncbi:hypothetical protein B0H14DRAFT_2966540 [Mycena olivaceomarginata]|nr:hypothetical protein B0H14DRAFT_2966540 [Mycena olivaceomarginata]